MPRAKDNRKPVGTETCHKCGEEAEFYQVQKGRYMGYLYRKGCECKADQRTLPYVQLEWLARMKRTPHPMVPHPLESAGEPPEEPAPKPKSPEPEPRATSEGEPAPEPNRNGLIGLALVAGATALALFS